jgi:two-component system, OmpR family, sensor histidine kinase KdpD
MTSTPDTHYSEKIANWKGLSPIVSAYGTAVVVVVVCTLIAGLLSEHVHPFNLMMIYLLGIVWIAVKGEKGPAMVVAVLSVLSFHCFFGEPQHECGLSDTEYLLTVSAVLIISLLICKLSTDARRQATIAEQARLQAETERIRNTLLSSISHDLRTPLAAIKGAASALFEQDVSGDAQRELVQSIYDESDRLNHLLINVLNVTRLETGAMKPRKDWHILEEVIGAALGRLERRLRDHEVKLDVPEDLPLFHFDETMIEQVITNILENARKYASPKGKIFISARKLDGDLLVEIANEGQIIANGDERAIFDKYYRSKDPNTMGSVGLGLAICKNIVEMHGGRIWAENVGLQGVKFSFTIPNSANRPIIEAELESQSESLEQ